MIRESSPPDAASRSGEVGIPGFVAISSSTASEPEGAYPSGCGSIETSSRAPSMASSPSSAATLSESGSAALRRPLRSRAASSARRSLRLREAPGELAGELVGVLEPGDLPATALGVGEHRLDRAAVLAAQAIDRVEPLLDRLEPARLGLDPLQVASAARRPHRRARSRRRAGARRARRATASTPSAAARRPSADPSAARAPPPSSSAPLVATSAPAAASRSDSAWRRRSRSASELGELRGVGRDRLDLAELEAHQVEVALARPLALAQVLELAAEAQRLDVRLAVAVSQLEVLGPREPVEDLELGRGERQPAVLVLAVEGQQARAEGLQVGGRRRPAPDEGARPARAPDPAPEDDLVGALGQPLADLRQRRRLEQPRREREHPLDPRLVGAGADDLRTGPPAEQQVERVREHRLAGPGLAGDRVQPRLQAQLGALDQRAGSRSAARAASDPF